MVSAMRVSLTGGDDMNRMRPHSYYDLTTTYGHDMPNHVDFEREIKSRKSWQIFTLQNTAFSRISGGKIL